MKNTIERYEKLGIKIWEENGKIKFSGPVKLIDKEFLLFIKNNQSGLLEYFSKSDLENCDILASKNQMALWLEKKMGNNTGNVHNGMIKKFNGVLEVDKVKVAFDRIIERHDILRSTFYELDNEVYLKINENNDSYFMVDKSLNKNEFEALDSVKKEINKTLDLLNGPLFKVIVCRFAENGYFVAFWAHHIITDAYSLFVIEKEFYNYFDELVNGRVHVFAEIENDSTFLKNEIKYFGEQQYNDDLRFWEDVLNPKLSGTTLPKYKIDRETEKNYTSKTIKVDFSYEESQNIDRFCKEYHCTPYVVFFSVFNLLMRYAGESDDTSTGLFTVNRTTEQQLNQVGYFSNALVFQMTLNSGLSFDEYVTEVKKLVLKLLGHQQMPFTELVERINPVRSNGMPFFNVVFDSLMFPDDLDKEELRKELGFENVDLVKGSANYDLIIWLSKIKGCYSFEYRYNGCFFDEFQIEGLAESMNGILNNLFSYKSIQLSELPLLYGKHKELMKSINSTKVDITENDVVSCVIKQCEIYKDNPAIDFYGNVLSYNDLKKMVTLISNILRNEEIKTGDYVGVMLKKSQYLIPLILGIWSVGAVYVPIDPNYPENRKKYIISNTKLNVIIQEKDTFLIHDVAVIYIERIANIWLENQYSNLPSTFDYKPLDQSMPAYIIYTSGSTGNPKGVVISHRSFINFLEFFRGKLELSSGEKMLSITSICFDMNFLELFLPLVSGAEVVMLSYEDSLSGRELYETITSKAVNVMQATPSTYELLLECYSNNTQAKILDKCICGGESYELDLVEKIQKMSKRVFNAYGPTETTIWSTVYEIPYPCDKIRLGIPIANTAIRISDQNGRELPLGYPGEILLGGEGLMLGYFNNPELTNEVTVKTEDGLFYKTGDWCYISQNGELNFLGRKDNQVKIRGFRIELAEIENVFRKSDMVANAAAIVLKDNNITKLVVIVIPKHEKNIDVDELKQYVSEYLPSYMIPNFIFIENSFPMTETNKIDRKAITERVREHYLKNNAEKRNIILDFSDPIEVQIKDLWVKILNNDCVSLDEGFFEAGGNSILLNKLSLELEKVFNKRIDIIMLLKYNTIRKMALYIKGENSENIDNDDLMSKTLRQRNRFLGRRKK